MILYYIILCYIIYYYIYNYIYIYIIYTYIYVYICMYVIYNLKSRAHPTKRQTHPSGRRLSNVLLSGTSGVNRSSSCWPPSSAWQGSMLHWASSRWRFIPPTLCSWNAIVASSPSPWRWPVNARRLDIFPLLLDAGINIVHSKSMIATQLHPNSIHGI